MLFRHSWWRTVFSVLLSIVVKTLTGGRLYYGPCSGRLGMTCYDVMTYVQEPTVQGHSCNGQRPRPDGLVWVQAREQWGQLSTVRCVNGQRLLPDGLVWLRPYNPTWQHSESKRHYFDQVKSHRGFAQFYRFWAFASHPKWKHMGSHYTETLHRNSHSRATLKQPIK